MLSKSAPYSPEFFDRALAGSYRSAQQVATLVCSLIHPQSVLDVGCGVGAFLKAFSEAGVPSLLGLDGEYVPREKLMIDANCFMPADLAMPLRLGRRFDLVVSLEVAEHLPVAAASTFVQSLVDHGDVVLFSAAIPGQGGVNHVNEQWPSYWAAIFADHGLQAYDLIRPRIWADDRIEWWYRQNCLIFARPQRLHEVPALATANATAHSSLNLVHPNLHMMKTRMLATLTAQLTALTNHLATGTHFRVSKQPDAKLSITKLS